MNAEELEKENVINSDVKLNIKLDNFEGPLDLLCFLIDKKKMDITEISIFDISMEYLDIIKLHQKYNLEIGSEFIQMAARLVYLKSKELLPKEEKEEEESLDNLMHKILEYKKYKENLPNFINAYEENNGRVLKKAEEIEVPKKEFNKEYNISLITDSYKDVYYNVKNKKNENSKNVEKLALREKFSVKKTIKQILNNIQKSGKIVFNKMFSVKEKPKGEVIAGFLGILELGKKEEVKIKQEENFSDIIVEKNTR